MLESHPILTYTIAPLRKEEVQANGHRLQNNHQGRDARDMVLHPSLVMFEHPPFDQISLLLLLYCYLPLLRNITSLKPIFLDLTE